MTDLDDARERLEAPLMPYEGRCLVCGWTLRPCSAFHCSYNPQGRGGSPDPTIPREAKIRLTDLRLLLAAEREAREALNAAKADASIQERSYQDLADRLHRCLEVAESYARERDEAHATIATLQAERDEALLASGFRQDIADDKDLADRIDECAADTLDVEGLRSHYACAMANWSLVLDEVIEARATNSRLRKLLEHTLETCQHTPLITDCDLCSAAIAELERS